MVTLWSGVSSDGTILDNQCISLRCCSWWTCLKQFRPIWISKDSGWAWVLLVWWHFLSLLAEPLHQTRRGSLILPLRYRIDVFIYGNSSTIFWALKLTSERQEIWHTRKKYEWDLTMVDTDPTNTNTLYKEVTIMLIIMMKSAMYFILHEYKNPSYLQTDFGPCWYHRYTWFVSYTCLVVFRNFLLKTNLLLNNRDTLLFFASAFT